MPEELDYSPGLEPPPTPRAIPVRRRRHKRPESHLDTATTVMLSGLAGCFLAGGFGWLLGMTAIDRNPWELKAAFAIVPLFFGFMGAMIGAGLGVAFGFAISRR